MDRGASGHTCICEIVGFIDFTNAERLPHWIRRGTLCHQPMSFAVSAGKSIKS